jgi:ribosomal protein L11 methyltransferase
MKWYEVSIRTVNEAQEAISEMLMSLGAGGVSVEDPLDIKDRLLNSYTDEYCDPDFMERIMDEMVIIKAYFNETVKRETLTNDINSGLENVKRFLPVGEGSVNIEAVDDEDWANAWKVYFKPFKIAEDLVISPSWENYTPGINEQVIRLDPGMAFGSGQHETTALCVQLIRKFCKKGDNVLDIGTGSGILAIAAIFSGAIAAVGVDIDPVAVKVARENATLNNVSGKSEFICGDLVTRVTGSYNLITANIISDIIIKLTPSIPLFLKEDGVFIASGVIDTRMDEVKSVFISNGFEITDMLQAGGWVAFACVKG